MFDLSTLPDLTSVEHHRELFRSWPTDRMLADSMEAADYSHFDQNDALTVFDLPDGSGVEYHVATNTVVRYRRISLHTVVREFIVFEEVQ